MILLESRVLGNLHARFGVGGGVKLPALHHDESAASGPQTEKRLDIIKKAILRSAGHAKGISVVMPCTVIRRIAR